MADEVKTGPFSDETLNLIGAGGPMVDVTPVKQLRPPPDFHENLTADPPREIPAAERLRAFEDEAFKGSQIQVVRIGDRLERGNGSAFAALPDEKKRQYVALEKLVVTEQKLADAHAALIAAEAEHEAALADAESKPDAE